MFNRDSESNLVRGGIECDKQAVAKSVMYNEESMIIVNRERSLICTEVR